MIARSAEQEPPPRVEIAQPAAGLFGAPRVLRSGECQEPGARVLGLGYGRPLGDVRRRLPAAGRHQEQAFVYGGILVDAQPPSPAKGISSPVHLIRLKRRAPRSLERRLALLSEPYRVVAESEPDPGEQSDDHESAADEGGRHRSRV